MSQVWDHRFIKAGCKSLTKERQWNLPEVMRVILDLKTLVWKAGSWGAQHIAERGGKFNFISNYAWSCRKWGHSKKGLGWRSSIPLANRWWWWGGNSWGFLEKSCAVRKKLSKKNQEFIIQTFAINFNWGRLHPDKGHPWWNLFWAATSPKPILRCPLVSYCRREAAHHLGTPMSLSYQKLRL